MNSCWTCNCQWSDPSRMRAAHWAHSQSRAALKTGFQDISTSGGCPPPGWISSCLLNHPDLLLEGMDFPGTLDALNTLPRWLLRKGGLTLSLWKSPSLAVQDSPGALQRDSDLCYFPQLGITPVLPPMLLRYPKEIKFCLSIQTGHKLQLERKGLPQEIVSSLTEVQNQFMYLSLPSSTAYNLYFCALFLAWMQAYD